MISGYPLTGNPPRQRGIPLVSTRACRSGDQRGKRQEPRLPAAAQEQDEPEQDWDEGQAGQPGDAPESICDQWEATS